MSKLPHQAEGVGEERGVEAPGGVLADHPGLKGGEQERGGDAAEEPATRQDPEVVEQLGDARDDVADGVDDTDELAAVSREVNWSQHRIASTNQHPIGPQ